MHSIQSPARPDPSLHCPNCGTASPDPAQPLCSQCGRLLPGLGPTPRRSVGAMVLLGLGGLCLVVAAVVFLSVSWTSLTLGAKTGVLAAVTGLLALAATEVSRRGLRGSAETLWAITLIDLALDEVAAWAAGLFGLDRIADKVLLVLGPTSLAVLALACCLATRRTRLGRSLVSSQLLLGGYAALALAAALAISNLPAGLAIPAELLGLLGLGVAARRTGLAVASWCWTVFAAPLWLVELGTGLGRLQAGGFGWALWHGQAWELPTAALLALVFVAVPPVPLNRPVQLGLTGTGFGLGSIVIVAGLASYLPLPGALAVSLLVAAGMTWLRQQVWRTAGLLVLAANLAVSLVVLYATAIAGLRACIEPQHWLWSASAATHLVGWQPWPVLSELILLVACCLVLAARLPSLVRPEQLADLVRWLTPLTGLLAVAIGCSAHPSVLLASLAWLLVAAIIVLTVNDRRVLAVAAAAVLFGEATALTSGLASLLAFGAGAAASLLATRRYAEQLSSDGRTAIELGALGQLFVAIVAGSYHGNASSAIERGLLACAVATALVAAISPSRRWWAWLSAAALTGSIWIQAATMHLTAPEPYTLPAGALLVAIGIRARRLAPERSSWTVYGPGLLVLTLPSLVLALAEPLSWRAAAVGLAALLILLTGAHRRLQAPLLIGAGELATLVLREVGPYALAVPRWAAIGAAGVLLLAIGVTWESRLADLHRARHRLATLA